jgi:hypothetical protein
MIVIVGTAIFRTASDLSSNVCTLSGGCGLKVPSGASPGQIRTWLNPGPGRQTPGVLTGGCATDDAELSIGMLALEPHAELISANVVESKVRPGIITTFGNGTHWVLHNNALGNSQPVPRRIARSSSFGMTELPL